MHGNGIFGRIEVRAVMSAIGPYLPRRPFAFASFMKGKAAAALAKPRGS
jgi:hypothetical protein